MNKYCRIRADYFHIINSVETGQINLCRALRYRDISAYNPKREKLQVSVISFGLTVLDKVHLLYLLLLTIFRFMAQSIVVFLKIWLLVIRINAHQIRISEILPCDRKSYLTQAVKWGATDIGCIGTHAHCSQVTSLFCLSDVTVYNCILACSGTSGSLFKKKNSGEQEKNNLWFM